MHLLSYLSAFDPAAFFTWHNLIFMLIGTIEGMLIGAMPGLSATVAMIFLLPVTYSMDTIPAILMMLCCFQAANYGGSISSICLGVPGTPGAVPTLIDGAPMARSGKPGKALGYSLTASTIGGLFSAILVIVVAQPFSVIAEAMAAPEYTIIALIGIIIASTLSSTDYFKVFVAIGLGFMMATIGTDDASGFIRFTMGSLELTSGVELVAVIVGVYAIPELIKMISKDMNKAFSTADKEAMRNKVTPKEVKKVGRALSIGAILGAIIGVVPGMGSAVAPFITHPAAQNLSKTHKDFPYGTGNPEGIVAAEAANNAGVGGELIPLLIFSLPTTSMMAILYSAFIIHGLHPGPKLFTVQADVGSIIVIGLFFSTIFMYVVGRVCTRGFAHVLTVPNWILVPVLFVFCVVGAYATTHTVWSVMVTLALGVLAFIMNKLKIPVGAAVLAYIMCKMVETNFQRSLIIGHGSLSIFVTRIGSLCLLIALIVAFFGIIIGRIVKSRKKAKAKKAAAEAEIEM